MRNIRSYPTLPTALLVDYEDVCGVLRARLGRSSSADAAFTDALEALVSLLQRQMNAQVVVFNVYADQETPREAVRDVLALGARAVLSCENSQRNASELELAMDGTALLATRPDLRRVVVVTGQRLYQPLLRRVKSEGRQVVLVSVEALRNRAAVLLDDQDRVMSIFELVPDAARPELAEAAPLARRDVTYTTIEDDGQLKALEIIEEFFGQYTEVYLTPLLRKLSDELDDDTLDPKSLISDLEEAGAVYLEKRRGYPHDYTVLLVDGNHPDVDRIRQMFEDYEDEEVTDEYLSPNGTAVALSEDDDEAYESAA